MTAPAYRPPPGPPYEPPPEEDDNPVLAAAVTLLVAYLASRAAIAAVTLPAALVAQLTSTGLAPKAVKAAGRMALSVPMTGRSRWGAPTVGDKTSWTGPGAPSMARRVAADEPAMRARYIINASTRLTRALINGAFLDGLTAERRHLTAHVEAGRNRSRAARHLDDLTARHGRWLRWVTVLDRATTPDCAALNGVVFSTDDPPGVPGAMHPRCRCHATPAFTGPFGA